MGLKEYVATKAPNKSTCRICGLSTELRTEVEEGRIQAGVSYENIKGYLHNDHDITVSANTIRKHFVEGHVSWDS